MKIIRLQQDAQTPTPDVWTLDVRHRVLQVGRDPACNMFLDDHSVSMQHATLTWQNGVIVIRDHGSINGITLRNRRIQRAEFKEASTLFIGSVPIRIQPETSDQVARIRAVLWRAVSSVGALAALLLVGVALQSMHTGEESAPEVPFEPLVPAVPDAATQAYYQKLQESYRLTEKGTRLIAEENGDQAAARLFIQAIQLVDVPDHHARIQLAGLQGKHLPGAEQRIRQAVARQDFDAAQAALDEISQYFVEETPAPLAPLKTIITQNRAFQNALTEMETGSLDEAERQLQALDPLIVPAIPETLARIRAIREAGVWVEAISAAVDAGQFEQANEQLAKESQYRPVLTMPLQDDLASAKFRLYQYSQILSLVNAGNVYQLAAGDFTADVPAIAKPVAKLQKELRKEKAVWQQRATDAATLAGDATQAPQNEAEAFASLTAAKAYAALYVMAPTEETQFPFLLHSGRWNAFLQSLMRRIHAYAAQGANAEIRALLEPLLPQLDAQDPAAMPLFQTARQLGVPLP